MSKTTHDSTNKIRGRLGSVDALRGLVMVLMALDHARDYFGDMRWHPEDPATTPVWLYLTRWVTHFCAPTFVFLAGVSAWLYGQRVPSRNQLSWFLLTRGAWLILLEFTVVYFGIALSLTVMPWIFLVLSAIGASMIALAALCWLPTRIVGLIGLAIVCLHNLLDAVHVSSAQPRWLAALWMWLHDGPGYLPAVGINLNVEIGYPVLAWIGVIATGYGFAPLLRKPPRQRAAYCLIIGAIAISGFLILRASNLYGDPNPWQLYDSAGKPLVTETQPSESGSAASDKAGMDLARTTMSFLRCQKYPPSLCFLLMTLGPAVIVLGLFDLMQQEGIPKRTLQVYGRVPLFFYVIHFYVLHLASCFFYWAVRGEFLSPMQAIYGQLYQRPIPESYGFRDPWLVYGAWITLLAIMYPLCLAYGRFKARARSSIWAYL